MKLYYAPGACSLATHIVLRETGMPFEAVKTDIHAKKLPDGSDFFAVNPAGAVPALQLDSGDVLTENPAVLQYIADMAGTDQLIPKSGLGRYRVIEALSYVGSEVHKSYGPLWNPASSDEVKQAAVKMVAKKLQVLEDKLQPDMYLTGEEFTPADAYLFVMLTWTDKFGIDLASMPKLAALRERVKARPATQEAMREEGLLQ